MNRLMRRRRERRADDSGASLLITLAFVAFVGLVAGALLSFSGTSLHGASSTKFRTDLLYDADGALQVGINQVRHGTYANDPYKPPCDVTPGDDTSNVLQFAGSNRTSNSTVAVTCEGGPGTGIDGGLVPVEGGNKPEAALLTLGTSGPGLTVSGNPGSLDDGSGDEAVFGIKGQVYVNGDVVASDPQTEIQVIDAQLHAGGTCSSGSGTVTSDPAPSCNEATTADGFKDPAIASPGKYAVPTTDMTYRKVPACVSGGVTKFEPGYYNDAYAMNELFKTCSSTAFWFAPKTGGGKGIYYFDFHNADPGDTTSVLPTASSAGCNSADRHLWCIDSSSIRVVGGTARGWNTSTGAGLSIPDACVNPANASSVDGVEWVFGGDSRLEIKAGQLEICGQYYSPTSGNLPIAVMGAKTGADTVVGPELEPATGAVSSGAAVFSAPTSDALTPNGTASTAALGGGSPAQRDAVLTFNGIAPTTAVPAGSLLKEAKIVVVHKNAKTVAADDLQTLTVEGTANPAGSAVAIPAVNVPQHEALAPATWSTDEVDVTTVNLAREIHARGLTDMRIVLRGAVTGSNKINLQVDSVQLKLTFKPPAMRAQSGCVVTGISCPLIKTGPGSGPLSYFQGTTYAPKSHLDLTLNNKTGQVFRWGLIVRSLAAKLTGSFTSGYPVIELPDDSDGYIPTDVYFKAYRCPEGSTCTVSGDTLSAGWKIAATARVRYRDADAAHVSPGHREVKVLGWTTYR